MTEQERELDLALAETEEDNKQLRAKLADYEALIRDLTEALRVLPERNAVLEEVARDFDSMSAFGDTAASFAVHVRGMKQCQTENQSA
jgi:hypothetical protein